MGEKNNQPVQSKVRPGQELGMATRSRLLEESRGVLVSVGVGTEQPESERDGCIGTVDSNGSNTV